MDVVLYILRSTQITPSLFLHAIDSDTVIVHFYVCALSEHDIERAQRLHHLFLCRAVGPAPCVAIE